MEQESMLPLGQTNDEPRIDRDSRAAMLYEGHSISGMRLTGSLMTRDEFLGIPASRPTRESVLKRLSEALMRRSLTKIDLSQRGLRPSDARLVKMALFQNAFLSNLKLGYNNLGSDGVATLAPGIAAHKALASLDLGFNNIGDEGCRALASALQHSCCAAPPDSAYPGTLHTLYLAGNIIGEDGALAIADVLRQGCSLRRLHLTGNSLGPDGVIAITEAIVEEELRRENTGERDKDKNFGEEKLSTLDASINSGQVMSAGLHELFLGGTSMGPSGCMAVARMLERSTTMRVISLTNCAIGDSELEVLASSIKENRARLPLEALQLSFNEITCKGLDSLMNAIWGSRTLRELLLDNNEIGDRGAQQVAAILPHVKTLEVLDLGFNSIKSSGMRTLMKVVAEAQHLVSLSVSGNAIDTAAAKVVAFALAYNRSLKSLFLVHCSIEHEGQRHIAAGIVSNSGIGLRKLTGFRLGSVIVSIGLPSELEHWTNEQVLNFIHLMWEQANQEVGECSEESELDPLNFLPGTIGEATGRRHFGAPLDATVVVEVARRTFASIGENGHDLLAGRGFELSLDSPLAEDAIMVEGSEENEMQQNVRHPLNRPPSLGVDENGERWSGEAMLSNPAKSFVAPPSEPAKPAVPDPARKRRIVDWLCKNIQYLNELSQQPFSSVDLWRMHQHYFTPVVNESGGSLTSSPNQSTDAVARIVSSVPEVSRAISGNAEPHNVTPSTQSSDEHVMVPYSDPSLPGSPPGLSLPMLKRKVSYRFLGDAAIPPQARAEVRHQSIHAQSVSKLIEDGTLGHSMPPKTKRARRNKTRISFLPRIKAKLDACLDVDHEKALVLLRRLFYIERALLSGKIHGCDQPVRSTHLTGVEAEEAEMILIDMI